MQDHAKLPPPSPGESEVLGPPTLQAVIRALAGALTAGSTRSARLDDPVAARPLLDLEETAELLAVSRMTIARLADEGRLPSVVIRRGKVQKTRRIPRAFVDRMIADACAGAQVDMEEYAAAWLAEHTHAPEAERRIAPGNR
jgi:excisionase family DNA binding protein